MTFETKELVRAARRDNNTKRPYLLVNPSQGKHVPVAPSRALALFDALCKQVQYVLPEQEPVLVIAFAETATAIGAAIAAGLKNPAFLIQTTREMVKDTSFVYFSETHSHAAEQRIATKGLDEIIRQVRHIVFAEDEVTTGNTILHLIDALRAHYALHHVQFGVVSILNGMDNAHHAQYQSLGIWTRALLRTDNRALAQQAAAFAPDGKRFTVHKTHTVMPRRLYVAGAHEMRTVCDAARYREAVQHLAACVADTLDAPNETVLVLGTEECMYPGLCVGYAMEQKGAAVRFHATTRSPILPSHDAQYPLQTRWELRSGYDSSRVTYVYNLTAYDAVYIVTDRILGDGIDTLLSALERAGNQRVTIVEWRQK